MVSKCFPFPFLVFEFYSWFKGKFWITLKKMTIFNIFQTIINFNILPISLGLIVFFFVFFNKNEVKLGFNNFRGF